jgi:hypothetical protein
VPQAVDVLGLVAAHLALDDAGLGTFGAVGGARRETPPLVETVGTHEAPQRGIRRHRLQIGARQGEGDEVVVVELHAPAPVRGVLGEQLTANSVADCVLLAGIGAQLAAQRADRIGALAQCAVVPALYGREAEADGLAGARMLPRAGSQLLDRAAQLALAGRRCQQLADDGEAQVRPSLVHTCLSRHSSPSRSRLRRP